MFVYPYICVTLDENVHVEMHFVFMFFIAFYFKRKLQTVQLLEQFCFFSYMNDSIQE